LCATIDNHCPPGRGNQAQCTQKQTNTYSLHICLGMPRPVMIIKEIWTDSSSKIVKFSASTFMAKSAINQRGVELPTQKARGLYEGWCSPSPIHKMWMRWRLDKVYVVKYMNAPKFKAKKFIVVLWGLEYPIHLHQHKSSRLLNTQVYFQKHWLSLYRGESRLERATGKWRELDLELFKV
jgi:hypothetical protein